MSCGVCTFMIERFCNPNHILLGPCCRIAFVYLLQYTAICTVTTVTILSRRYVLPLVDFVVRVSVEMR